jgi:ATP-dependent Lon protease
MSKKRRESNQEEQFLGLISGQGDDNIIQVISNAQGDDTDENEQFPSTVPLAALKNTVLFPGIVIPINVGREKSLKAMQEAFRTHKFIAVFAQRDMNEEEAGAADIYPIGVLAKIVRLLNMPDGSKTAILQGKRRMYLEEVISEDPYMHGKVSELNYSTVEKPMELNALISSIREQAKRIIELSPNIPTDAIMILKNISSNSFLLNFIASNLNVEVEQKQMILEQDDLIEKANIILKQINKELQMLEIKDQIENKVRGDIEKQQRDYFLNQQMRAIQEELGQGGDLNEVQELLDRADKKNWSVEVGEAFEKEIHKLERMNPQAPDYSVQLNYIELMLDLPWETFTKDNFNLNKVLKVLNQDHYGLEEVKERILEYLAVLKLKGDMKAPILCLVGPPGVGKTSLGKSIAKAVKRNFVRMSLGGLHDESEIRGHRKTYIGAMPGRIIKSLKKAGSSNPVFILDEIDKVGKDFRGDPSSALLEVLDPEQNNAFHDNYLELDYDLSKVLFIATANSLNTIQPALRDRMEIIEISGYSTEEKIQIAKRHLVPELLEEIGLQKSDFKLKPPAIKFIIGNYTRESGVRKLKQTIGKVMRRIAKKVAMEEDYNRNLPIDDVRKLLGPERFSQDVYKAVNVPGVAIGLAWTSVGGEILFIESSLSTGNGKVTLTGNLGDVMKESATTALSFVKAHAEMLGIDPKLLKEKDIHIHVPEGAIPKDGPSAGITMLAAITSAFTQKVIKPYVAMTGEITLRGKVLPVGGIKEKVLAAKRSGIKEIILSTENEKHVAEIPKDYIKDMTFSYISEMKEVLTNAFK